MVQYVGDTFWDTDDADTSQRDWGDTDDTDASQHRFIAHHSSLIIHHSSFITHHSSFITHHSSLPNPSHHSISHTHGFAEANAGGQGYIGLKIKGKAQDFYAFVLHPVLFEQGGDLERKAFGDLPADTGGKGHDVRAEQTLEVGVLFGKARQAAVVLVIFGVEGLPVVNTVTQGRIRDAQRVLVYIQARDAQLHVALTDAHAPIGLTKKVVRLLHAVLEAEEQGPELISLSVHLILYERITQMKAARLVVVVVKPLVLQPYFMRHRCAKMRQLPGRHMGIKSDGKETK